MPGASGPFFVERIVSARQRLVKIVGVIVLVALAVGVLSLFIPRPYFSPFGKRPPSVTVPMYPGATDVARREKPEQLLFLQVTYEAPVAYPSTAVGEFYRKELPAQGWVLAQPGEPLGWGSWEDPASRIRRQYLSALVDRWHNPKLNLDLMVYAVGAQGVKYQEVRVNVLRPLPEDVKKRLMRQG